MLSVNENATRFLVPQYLLSFLPQILLLLKDLYLATTTPSRSQGLTVFWNNNSEPLTAACKKELTKEAKLNGKA